MGKAHSQSKENNSNKHSVLSFQKQRSGPTDKMQIVRVEIEEEIGDPLGEFELDELNSTVAEVGTISSYMQSIEELSLHPSQPSLNSVQEQPVQQSPLPRAERRDNSWNTNELMLPDEDELSTVHEVETITASQLAMGAYSFQQDQQLPRTGESDLKFFAKEEAVSPLSSMTDFLGQYDLGDTDSTQAEVRAIGSLQSLLAQDERVSVIEEGIRGTGDEDTISIVKRESSIPLYRKDKNAHLFEVSGDGIDTNQHFILELISDSSEVLTPLSSKEQSRVKPSSAVYIMSGGDKETKNMTEEQVLRNSDAENPVSREKLLGRFSQSLEMDYEEEESTGLSTKAKLLLATPFFLLFVGGLLSLYYHFT